MRLPLAQLQKWRRYRTIRFYQASLPQALQFLYLGFKVF